MIIKAALEALEHYEGPFLPMHLELSTRPAPRVQLNEPAPPYHKRK
jgi:hypothetical protein